MAYATYAIAAVCVWVYALGAAAGGDVLARGAHAFGVVPAVLSGRGVLPPELALVPPPLTLFTAPFVHFELLPFVLNVVGLLLVGPRIEASMSRRAFVLFVVAGSILAMLLFAALTVRPAVPITGAQFAVTALFAGVLVIAPRGAFRAGGLRLPWWLLTLGWLLLNALLVQPQELSRWLAHACAAAAGVNLVLMLKRRRVPLAGN